MHLERDRAEKLTLIEKERGPTKVGLLCQEKTETCCNKARKRECSFSYKGLILLALENYVCVLHWNVFVREYSLLLSVQMRKTKRVVIGSHHYQSPRLKKGDEVSSPFGSSYQVVQMDLNLG